MPNPKTTEAYAQHVEAMLSALEAEHGARVSFSSPTEAKTFRRLCYKARLIQAESYNDRSMLSLVISLEGSTVVIRKPPKINVETF